MCEVSFIYVFMSLTLCHVFSIRFVVNSLAGVKLAEKLCENPKTCLTIFASEFEDEIKSVLELKEPHYLINILQVIKNSNKW